MFNKDCIAGGPCLDYIRLHVLLGGCIRPSVLHGAADSLLLLRGAVDGGGDPRDLYILRDLRILLLSSTRPGVDRIYSNPG